MILPRRPLPQATGSDEAGEDRKCPPSGKGDRVGVVAPHGGRGTKDGGRGFGGGRLGCGFRQPNSETEFGGSVIGIGPLRPAGGRGTARRVVVPYGGGCGELPRLPWGSGAQRSVCASGVGIGAEVTPKGASNAGQSLSHGEAVTAPVVPRAWPPSIKFQNGIWTSVTVPKILCSHTPTEF